MCHLRTMAAEEAIAITIAIVTTLAMRKTKAATTTIKAMPVIIPKEIARTPPLVETASNVELSPMTHVHWLDMMKAIHGTNAKLIALASTTSEAKEARVKINPLLRGTMRATLWKDNNIGTSMNNGGSFNKNDANHSNNGHRGNGGQQSNANSGTRGSSNYFAALVDNTESFFYDMSFQSKFELSLYDEEDVAELPP